jgi:hypothetical protein
VTDLVRQAKSLGLTKEQLLQAVAAAADEQNLI